MSSPVSFGRRRTRGMGVGEAVSPLAARRLAVGHTQEALAELLGVAVSTVGRWERGTQTPQPWQRADLAKNLQITLTELGTLLEQTTGRDRAATPLGIGLADRQAIATAVRDSQQAWLRVRQAPGVRGRE